MCHTTHRDPPGGIRLMRAELVGVLAMYRRRHYLVAVGVIILVGLVAATPAGAQDEFDITVPDAFDVPPRTVSIQDRSYIIDGTLRTAPGINRTVAVTAPDVIYRVYVYDRDQQIVESRRGNGSSSFTFDFANYQPGSYAIAVNHDGDIKTVFPIVVKGYEMSHDAPRSTEPGDTISVTVELTQTLANQPPADVRVIVANANTELRVEADQQGGPYVADVSLADLSGGTYTLWAVAQSDETAFGHQAVLGISTPTTLELADDTGTPDGSGGGSETGSASETATQIPASENGALTVTPVGTTRAGGSPTGGTPSTPDEPADDASTVANSVSDGSGEDIITPVRTSSIPSAGVRSGAVAAGLLAIAAISVLFWRRR